ncbi:CG12821 [Drosophila busckii]|uniref:Ubiquitin-like-conjugating enzyme ATG10 n=1 Tax=Drosophila busckii TaxID=30019 RepID=A0A0M5IXZ6_DROBS|nr:ubiquitin-like-conjugating enzyme ATG10 [Drosophila busckii]ALC42268.1 CG12821 [Drosophila busckii]
MTDLVSITWKDFLSQIKQFMDMSRQLDDSWSIYEKDMEEPNTFLQYTQKLKCKNELISVEYHIVYSISYQIPMLYFQAHRSDGSMLNIEAVWELFVPEATRHKLNLYEMLTQMEHPVLFRPYMALHPCRTAEVLAQFGEQSKNVVLTFISLYGPYVQLNLSNAYGLLLGNK